MAERASMTALVDFVERLVNDPANEAHSRDDIQAALDVYRIEARYEALTALPAWVGGAVAYRVFDADAPYWETDGTLYDAAYSALTPTTSDWTAGRWTFAAEPLRPVTILGWNHDPYQAAADLLEQRAAALAEDYDFATGPDSFKRSQRHGQLLAMAARYRAMSPRLKAVADAAADWTMPEITVDVFQF
ncbi:MAG: hypothetical protein K1X50_06100 [Candidatus Promineofilum sp.]|nr:hypothetical protein [Promineifilum sp.]